MSLARARKVFTQYVQAEKHAHMWRGKTGGGNNGDSLAVANSAAHCQLTWDDIMLFSVVASATSQLDEVDDDV